MAKNKVQIDVTVNDKGTTKKVALEAKKAATNLDSTAKSAGQADRKVKGVAQASSGATKNFSKMSQGMGGLVGIYATLAAQAFALSAAYEFLKRVGDLKVLKDSQIAYASSTGIAITSLTTKIRLASEGMLNFEDSSRAAAIGLSSGLSSGQLTKLAEGAASVSKVLGRDITDSFDRLIRGVTKAEPELLDELGIILRLESAKKKYAISIGKTVSQLSLLEEKQAVLVEVQEQLDQKFSGTTKAIDIQGNAVKKFGVAFNDVFVYFAKLIGPAVTIAANFFAKNITSLIAAISLFALVLVRSMLPNLDEFGKKAVANAKAAKKAFEDSSASFKQMEKASKGADTAKVAVSGIKGAKPGSGIYALQNDEFVNKRKASLLLKYAEQEKGVYNQLSKYQQVVYKRALRNILGQQETFVQKTNYNFRKIGDYASRQAMRVEVAWKKAMVGVTKAASVAGKGINLAFKLAGVIGIAMMLFDLAKEAGKFFGLIRPASAELLAFVATIEATSNSLASLTTEYSLLAVAMDQHLKVANKSNNPIKATSESYIKLGRAISTSARELADLVVQQNASAGHKDVEGGIKEDANGDMFYQEGVKFNHILEKSRESAKQLIEILRGTLGLEAFPRELGKAFEAALGNPAALKQLADDMELLAQTTSTFNESFKSSELNFQSFVQNISQYKTSATELLETTLKEIDTIATKFKIGDVGQLLLNTTTSESETKALIERLAFLKLIDKKETEQQINQLDADRKHNILVSRATDLVKERMQAEKKSLDLEIQYNAKLVELAVLEKEGINKSDEKYKILQGQTASLKEQMILQEELNSGLYKLGMAGAQAFESGFQSNLKDLITGQESSLKESIGKLLLSVGDALADELSNQITEKLMSIVLPLKKKPEELMNESILAAAKEAAALWQTSLTAAGKEFADKIKAAKEGPAITKDNNEINTAQQRLNVETTQGSLEKRGGTSATALWVRVVPEHGVEPSAQQSLAMTPTPGLAEVRGLTPDTALWVKIAPSVSTIGTDDYYPTHPGPSIPFPSYKRNEKSVVLDSTKGEGVKSRVLQEEIITGQGALTTATNEAEKTQVDLFKKGGVFDSVFTFNVDKMVSGMGGVLAGLLGPTGSTSGSILGMLLNSALGAAVGGAMSGPSIGAGATTNLATMNTSMADKVQAGFAAKMPGMATGGIASGSKAGYPMTLHGTEAVVPLPNGKSIPVEMKNGSAQNNNVVVNVSVDSQGRGQTSTESQSGADAGNLGNAIAKAVQQELQNQKRSGGILNPYGVA